MLVSISSIFACDRKVPIAVLLIWAASGFLAAVVVMGFGGVERAHAQDTGYIPPGTQTTVEDGAVKYDTSDTSDETVTGGAKEDTESQEKCDPQTGKGCNYCGIVSYTEPDGTVRACSKSPKETNCQIRPGYQECAAYDLARDSGVSAGDAAGLPQRGQEITVPDVSGAQLQELGQAAQELDRVFQAETGFSSFSEGQQQFFDNVNPDALYDLSVSVPESFTSSFTPTPQLPSYLQMNAGLPDSGQFFVDTTNLTPTQQGTLQQTSQEVANYGRLPSSGNTFTTQYDPAGARQPLTEAAFPGLYGDNSNAFPSPSSAFTTIDASQVLSSSGINDAYIFAGDEVWQWQDGTIQRVTGAQLSAVGRDLFGQPGGPGTPPRPPEGAVAGFYPPGTQIPEDQQQIDEAFEDFFSEQQAAQPETQAGTGDTADTSGIEVVADTPLPGTTVVEDPNTLTNFVQRYQEDPVAATQELARSWAASTRQAYLELTGQASALANNLRTQGRDFVSGLLGEDEQGALEGIPTVGTGDVLDVASGERTAGDVVDEATAGAQDVGLLQQLADGATGLWEQVKEGFTNFISPAIGRPLEVPASEVGGYFLEAATQVCSSALGCGGLQPKEYAMLLAAQAQWETNFDPDAGGPAGSLGLTQIQPGTARLHSAAFNDTFNDTYSAFDAGDAARMQAVILSEEINNCGGDVGCGLRAYNAGFGRRNISAAQTYEARVMENYRYALENGTLQQRGPGGRLEPATGPQVAYYRELVSTIDQGQAPVILSDAQRQVAGQVGFDNLQPIGSQVPPPTPTLTRSAASLAEQRDTLVGQIAPELPAIGSDPTPAGVEVRFASLGSEPGSIETTPPTLAQQTSDFSSLDPSDVAQQIGTGPSPESREPSGAAATERPGGVTTPLEKFGLSDSVDPDPDLRVQFESAANIPLPGRRPATTLLESNRNYTLSELRRLNNEFPGNIHLENFVRATRGLAGDRFVRGEALDAVAPVLEGYKEQFGDVPVITSAGRNFVPFGGSATSYHLQGMALDFRTIGVPQERTDALVGLLEENNFGEIITRDHGTAPHAHAGITAGLTPPGGTSVLTVIEGGTAPDPFLVAGGTSLVPEQSPFRPSSAFAGDFTGVRFASLNPQLPGGYTSFTPPPLPGSRTAADSSPTTFAPAPGTRVSGDLPPLGFVEAPSASDLTYRSITGPDQTSATFFNSQSGRDTLFSAPETTPAVPAPTIRDIPSLGNTPPLPEQRGILPGDNTSDLSARRVTNDDGPVIRPLTEAPVYTGQVEPANPGAFQDSPTIITTPLGDEPEPPALAQIDYSAEPQPLDSQQTDAPTQTADSGDFAWYKPWTWLRDDDGSFGGPGATVVDPGGGTDISNEPPGTVGGGSPGGQFAQDTGVPADVLTQQEQDAAIRNAPRIDAQDVPATPAQPVAPTPAETGPSPTPISAQTAPTIRAEAPSIDTIAPEPGTPAISETPERAPEFNSADNADVPTRQPATDNANLPEPEINLPAAVAQNDTVAELYLRAGEARDAGNEELASQYESTASELTGRYESAQRAANTLFEHEQTQREMDAARPSWLQNDSFIGGLFYSEPSHITQARERLAQAEQEAAQFEANVQADLGLASQQDPTTPTTPPPPEQVSVSGTRVPNDLPPLGFVGSTNFNTANPPPGDGSALPGSPASPIGGSSETLEQAVEDNLGIVPPTGVDAVQAPPNSASQPPPLGEDTGFVPQSVREAQQAEQERIAAQQAQRAQQLQQQSQQLMDVDSQGRDQTPSLDPGDTGAMPIPPQTTELTQQATEADRQPSLLQRVGDWWRRNISGTAVENMIAPADSRVGDIGGTVTPPENFGDPSTPPTQSAPSPSVTSERPGEGSTAPIERVADAGSTAAPAPTPRQAAPTVPEQRGTFTPDSSPGTDTGSARDTGAGADDTGDTTTRTPTPDRQVTPSTPPPSSRTSTLGRIGSNVGTGAQALLKNLQSLLGLGGQPQPQSGGGAPSAPSAPPSTGTPSTPNTPTGSKPPQLSCSSGAVVSDGSASVEISWTCQGATGSRGIGDTFNTGGGASGTRTVQRTDTSSNRLPANLEYGVECISGSNVVGRRTCTVPVLRPSVSLIAAPSEVQSGERVQLTWSSIDTLQCLIGAGGGEVLTIAGKNGNVESPALARATEFVAICATNARTTHTAKVLVSVTDDNREPLRVSTNSIENAAAGVIEATGSSSVPATQGTGSTGTNQQPLGGSGFTGVDAQGNTVQLCDPGLGLDRFTQCLVSNN